MKRESGQLASAVPRAPIPTGRPTHVFVPVMAAARMPPTAMMMEWPVLPSTCATNSVAISRPRFIWGSGTHRVSGRAGTAQRSGQVGELAEEWTRLARIHDLLDPERLGRAERRAQLVETLLDLRHLRLAI